MPISIQTATTHGPRVTLNKFVPETPHKICSVFPVVVEFHNHNGHYVVPACSEGAEYTYCKVNPGYTKYDLGEDKHLVNLSIPAKTVAEDFLGILAGRTDFLDRGLFVPEGEDPTKEELEQARSRMRLWFETQVQKADEGYGLHGAARFLESTARLAVRHLGLKRAWAESYVPQVTVDCPACMKPMTNGAKIHSVGEGGCGQRIGYDKEGAPFWLDERPVAPPVADEPKDSKKPPAVPNQRT